MTPPTDPAHGSTRHDGDSWDLATSVGATATAVAAARALASAEPDALIDDPFAAGLVHATGVDFFVRLVDGEIALDDEEAASSRGMAAVMAVRTRFFDDFFLTSAADGVRQAVILAAGLDTRAYRLAWPAGMVVYELDQPRVVQTKTAAMAELGASATAHRTTVAVDLREDWPAALRAAGFDTTAPTAWSAEGLLMYLPPEAQEKLFTDVTSLSAPGSRLATEYHPNPGAAGWRRSRLLDRSREYGLNLDLADLVYRGERRAVSEQLTELGWQVDSATRDEVFAGYGRTFPAGDEFGHLHQTVAVTATRR